MPSRRAQNGPRDGETALSEVRNPELCEQRGASDVLFASICMNLLRVSASREVSDLIAGMLTTVGPLKGGVDSERARIRGSG